MTRIAPSELAARRGVQLVDVREQQEFDEGRIAGAAHIPLGELTARAEEIDRDRPVVFYCRVGARSAMAADAFRASGYDASDLEGGLVAWRDAGLPLEPESGRVAEH